MTFKELSKKIDEYAQKYENSSVTFTVQCLIKSDLDLVDEWMEYGRLHGTGQWRNAGKGRFEFEVVK